MKKKLALILAGTAMAAMVLAGCGDKNNASGEDVKTAESVEDKKTFTVGFDAEYPPYGYMDENGEYTGFDLELAEAVCKLEGWELVKKPLNWDSKDMELEWIYHEWKGRRLYIFNSVCRQQSGDCCGRKIRY